MSVAAKSIIRFVPYVFLVSPSTGQELKYRLDDGLHATDASDLVQRCLTAEFTDSAKDLLTQARLVNMIAAAEDWRYMSEDEISAFLKRDALDEGGAGPGGDLPPPSDEDLDTMERDWTDAA